MAVLPVTPNSLKVCKKERHKKVKMAVNHTEIGHSKSFLSAGGCFVAISLFLVTLRMTVTHEC